MGLCLERPIADVIGDFRRGILTDADIVAMWYDWFCKPSSLVNKGKRLLTRLSAIYPSPRFDGTKTYVWFKNNCPVHGKLYDDFRIAEIGTSENVYTVVPLEGYNASYGESCVWGRSKPGADFEELQRGTWKDVKFFFQTPHQRDLELMLEATRRHNLIREAEWHNEQWDLQRADLIWRAEDDNRRWDEEHKRPDREYVERLEYMLNR